MKGWFILDDSLRFWNLGRDYLWEREKKWKRIWHLITMSGSSEREPLIWHDEYLKPEMVPFIYRRIQSRWKSSHRSLFFPAYPSLWSHCFCFSLSLSLNTSLSPLSQTYTNIWCNIDRKRGWVKEWSGTARKKDCRFCNMKDIWKMYSCSVVGINVCLKCIYLNIYFIYIRMYFKIFHICVFNPLVYFTHLHIFSNQYIFLTSIFFQLVINYLNSSFSQSCSLRKFFPGIYVRILSPFERFFQFFELQCCKSCPWSSLLPFQCQSWFCVWIAAIVTCCYRKIYIQGLGIATGTGRGGERKKRERGEKERKKKGRRKKYKVTKMTAKELIGNKLVGGDRGREREREKKKYRQ